MQEPTESSHVSSPTSAPHVDQGPKGVKRKLDQTVLKFEGGKSSKSGKSGTSTYGEEDCEPKNNNTKPGDIAEAAGAEQSHSPGTLECHAGDDDDWASDATTLSWGDPDCKKEAEKSLSQPTSAPPSPSAPSSTGGPFAYDSYDRPPSSSRFRELSSAL